MLPIEKQQEILEKNHDNFKESLSEINIPDCTNDYLLYVLAIKDKDIEGRAKIVKKKIEESIGNKSKQDNQDLLKQLQDLFIKNFEEVIWQKWLSCLEIYSKSESEIVLSAPTKFQRDWIKREFFGDNSPHNLEKVINQILPSVQKITVICIEKD